MQLQKSGPQRSEIDWVIRNWTGKRAGAGDRPSDRFDSSSFEKDSSADFEARERSFCNDFCVLNSPSQTSKSRLTWVTKAALPSRLGRLVT